MYYSSQGATKALAHRIARGVQQTEVAVKIRTVPRIGHASAEDLPETGDLYVTDEDLRTCSGLALGSPTRFGNMAAPLKYFLDSTSHLWLEGALIDKPATVFTSSDSLHGGQETTLFSMALPLLHHGMILIGVPYSQPELQTTKTGGTPYGASHVNADRPAFETTDPLSDSEAKIATSTGRRLGHIVRKLTLSPSPIDQ